MSGVVCLAACFCVLKVRLRLRYSRTTARAAWIVLGGSVLGIGVWSANVLELAGFDTGGPKGFDGGWLLGALAISIAGCTAALGAGWFRFGRARGLAAGLTLTAAFTALRLCAVCAFRTQAVVAWNPVLLGLSVGLAAAAAVSAFMIGGRPLWRGMVSAGLVAGSLWSLQLLGAAAETVTAAVASPLPGWLLSPQVATFLAVMLAGVAVLGGFGAAFIDDVSSRTALQRTRRLADAAREGILVVGEAGRVLEANAAAAALAGCSIGSLIGRPVAQLIELTGAPAPDGPVAGVLRTIDGQTTPVEVHARPLHDQDEREEPTSVVVIRDMREQHAVEAQLRFLSEHDPLTGLPNRAALRRMVEQHIEVGALLLFVRVLNHAETNSLLGHAAGDAVLEKLGQRLKRMTTGDTGVYTCQAARLGGAEFAFAAGGVMETSSPFPHQFARALSRPVVLDGHVIEPQIRVGVSCAPIDCHDADELFRHAEAALDVAARDDGGDTVIYYDQKLQNELVGRRTLIQELKVGIAQEQLVLHYQPLARTEDGRLCGFEALVRWNHPVRGFMSPDSFIPLAEHSGLITSLGEQVLRRACAEAATWPVPAPVAVNLSPLQVHQTDLPRLVHEVLLETGLPPARLELEITESALFRDFQRALDTLRRIKSLGVKIAMDDFGTGFSSLSTLQSFPFDKIKIDKSFVGVGDQRASVIVKAVLGIGRGLGVPVVAEGVETSEQLAFLRRERCDAVQGYLIGRPGPIGTHAALMDAWAAGRGEAKAPRRKALA